MYFCWLVYRGRIQAESIKPDGLAAGSREHLTTTSSVLSPILPPLSLSLCLFLLYLSVCLRLFVPITNPALPLSICLCLSASVCLSLSTILPPASLSMYLYVVSVCLPLSLCLCLLYLSVCLCPFCYS